MSSYPNSQVTESCCFEKKELPNLVLSVIFIYQYYKGKYNF